MKIGSISENKQFEKRIAITPEIAKKYINLGFEVNLVTNYGSHLGFNDNQYRDLGVKIISDEKELIHNSDLIIQLNLLENEKIALIKKNQTLVGIFDPYKNKEKIDLLSKNKINVFSLELLPRISRAQSMDILSSQANLAGYKAVIESFASFEKAIPMMMTAAGTIPAAKVLVVGAGVAGLQAIATAKRMGAIVFATDVRMASKEQVESLGGKFLTIEGAENLETEGGYAKEMPPEYFEKQKEVVAEHIKKQDVVITTALIPGRPAPVLITPEMVASMPDGAVIVDLAVESGGNCPLSELGKTVKSGGVNIIGPSNMPSRIAEDASKLFAKNLLNFITPLVDPETKSLKIDWEDEIVQGTLVCKDGKVVHTRLKVEGS